MNTPTPPHAGWKKTAADLVSAVRAGFLDPRPAAVALGLPFDQDAIMGILELAASPASPAQSDMGEMRERVARIVDPDGWMTHSRQNLDVDRLLADGYITADHAARLRKSTDMYASRSLAKADQIIALFPPVREPEGSIIGVEPSHAKDAEGAGLSPAQGGPKWTPAECSLADLICEARNTYVENGQFDFDEHCARFLTARGVTPPPLGEGVKAANHIQRLVSIINLKAVSLMSADDLDAINKAWNFAAKDMAALSPPPVQLEGESGENWPLLELRFFRGLVDDQRRALLLPDEPDMRGEAHTHGIQTMLFKHERNLRPAQFAKAIRAALSSRGEN